MWMANMVGQYESDFLNTVSGGRGESECRYLRKAGSNDGSTVNHGTFFPNKQTWGNTHRVTQTFIHTYTCTCVWLYTLYMLLYRHVCTYGKSYTLMWSRRLSYLQPPQTGLLWSCTGKFVIAQSPESSHHSGNIWFLGFLNLRRRAGAQKTQNYIFTWGKMGHRRIVLRGHALLRSPRWAQPCWQ